MGKRSEQERNDKGLCAGGACEAPLVDIRWVNQGNGFYYCMPCASAINWFEEGRCRKEEDLEALVRGWEEPNAQLG